MTSRKRRVQERVRQERRPVSKAEDRAVDAAVEMTFPASDPVAIGSPTSTEPPRRPLDRRPPIITRSEIEEASRGLPRWEGRAR